ncbi:MAG: hypothetical protein AB1416_00610 [Actinomycetota bacterium]
MAAPRPLRLVKSTLVAYGLALFVTAPFTGAGTADTPAASAAAPVAPLAQAGTGVDVLTFTAPVPPAELVAALPAGARVVSVSGRTPDGRESGFAVPDGVALGAALAMYGPEAASTPVVSVTVAHDDAVLSTLRSTFAGRLA